MKTLHGSSATVTRDGASDRHGDSATTSTHSVGPGAVDWNATYSNQTFQDVAVTDVDYYLPRSDDVKTGDRLTLAGRKFTVQGIPMWDQVHPMTGRDYGYKLVRLREVSGA